MPNPNRRIWADNDPTRPLSAARMNGLESDVDSLYDLAVNVKTYGAVADCDGTTGTDNLEAFSAAIAAAPQGSRVYIPAGRYYFSDTLTLDKVIDLDCGAGGIPEGTLATELVFAAGKTGIDVTADPGWRVGPLTLTSLSKGAGPDSGIVARGPGYGTLDRLTARGFGSHGIYFRAGAGVGGGIVNNSVLIRPRAFRNRGDGVRLEGSDANAIVIIKPDVVANFGWGINLEGTAHTCVIAAHADQQYNRSPGAYRDNGNSNAWRWLYSERGIGMTLAADSVFALIEVGGYGKPKITDNTAGRSAVIIDTEKGIYNSLKIYGNSATESVFKLAVDGYTESAFSISLESEASEQAKFCAVYQRNIDRWVMFAPVAPDLDATHDLGVPGNSWRNLYANGTVSPVTIKTTSYNVATTDNIVIADGASVTITLPNPTTALVGRTYTVKNINSAIATVRSAGSSKTLDGTLSQSLAQWAKATYITNGTEWLTV